METYTKEIRLDDGTKIEVLVKIGLCSIIKKLETATLCNITQKFVSGLYTNGNGQSHFTFRVAQNV